MDIVPKFVKEVWIISLGYNFDIPFYHYTGVLFFFFLFLEDRFWMEVRSIVYLTKLQWTDVIISFSS